MSQVLKIRLSSVSPEVSRTACVSIGDDITVGECLEMKSLSSQLSALRSNAQVATISPMPLLVEKGSV